MDIFWLCRYATQPVRQISYATCWHHDSVFALAERLRHAPLRLYPRDGVADDKVDARCAIECLDHFVFRRQNSTGLQLTRQLIFTCFFSQMEYYSIFE